MSELEQLTTQTILTASSAQTLSMTYASTRLLISLTFNLQLIPLLAFSVITFLSLLLFVFFTHVVPHLSTHSVLPLLSGVSSLAATAVSAALILRSLAILATDPFAAREHATLLKQVVKLSPLVVLSLAIALISASLALSLDFASSPLLWLCFSRAIALCAATQVAFAALFALYLDFPTLLADLKAAVRTKSPAELHKPWRSQMVIDRLVHAWESLLLWGKMVGLVAALLLAWLADPRLTGHTSLGEALIVLLFGQVACFAALWLVLEAYSVTLFLLASLRASWANVAKAAGVVLFAALASAAASPNPSAPWESPAVLPLIMIPLASLLSAAYCNHLFRQALRSAKRSKQAKGQARRRRRGQSQEEEEEHQLEETPSARLVANIIRGLIGVVLLLVFALLAYTAVQGWIAPPLEDVYTVATDEAKESLTITHAGFDGPQSTTVFSIRSPLGAGATREPGVEPKKRAGGNVCSLAWGDLNMFDVGLMAQFSYLDPSSASMDDVVASLYGPGGWEVSAPPRDPDVRVWFVEFYSAERNTMVLAVRGTNPSDPWDVVQDLAIWYPAALLQAAMALPTTVSLWPTELLANGVGLLGWAEELLSSGSSSGGLDSHFYHAPILEYLARRKEELPEDTQVLLTGHSLGGGLAKIVGSLSGHTAVSFSGPGLLLSRYRFGISAESLIEHTVSVVPTHDLVPRIDIHGGVVVQTTCVFRDPVMCHDPMGALSQVFDSCGSSLFPRLEAVDFVMHGHHSASPPSPSPSPSPQ